jgi:hypothetical protein
MGIGEQGIEMNNLFTDFPLPTPYFPPPKPGEILHMARRAGKRPDIVARMIVSQLTINR